MSAWEAASLSEPTVHDPSRTTTRHDDTSPFPVTYISTEVPQSCADAHTPRLQRTPHPAVRPSPSSNTPLVVSAADVRNARHDLGLTPRTPASASPALSGPVFLSPTLTAEARRLLLSARRAGRKEAAAEENDAEQDTTKDKQGYQGEKENEQQNGHTE